MSRIEITLAQYYELTAPDKQGTWPFMENYTEDSDMVRLETVAGGNLLVTLVNEDGNWIDGFEINPAGVV